MRGPGHVQFIAHVMDDDGDAGAADQGRHEEHAHLHTLGVGFEAFDVDPDASVASAFLGGRDDEVPTLRGGAVAACAAERDGKPT
jgi:hypothetical protein